MIGDIEQQIANTVASVAVGETRDFPAGIDGVNLRVRHGARGAKATFRLRYSFAGRRYMLNLGEWPAASYVTMTSRASEASSALANGDDPAAVCGWAGSGSSKAARFSFASLAQAYLAFLAAEPDAAEKATTRRQLAADLEIASEAFGKMPITMIKGVEVADFIAADWRKHNPMAVRRVRAIEAVTRWHFNRNGLAARAPEIMKTVRARLGRSGHKVQNYASTGFKAVPAIWQQLEAENSSIAKCAQLLILTCLRSNEARGLLKSDITTDEITGLPIILIPAARMKAGREHRVPLSRDARALIASLPDTDSEYLFTNDRTGKPFGPNAFRPLLGRLGFVDSEGKLTTTIHGFRSAARQWAGAFVTSIPENVIELTMLAHSSDNAVMSAYKRGVTSTDGMRLMQAWSDFALGKVSVAELESKAQAGWP